MKPVDILGEDGEERIIADVTGYVTVAARAFAELVARGEPHDEETVEKLLTGVFNLTGDLDDLAERR